jgi:uncharacterized alpha-E superfamily protein
MENSEQNGRGNSRVDRLENLMDLLITDHLAFTDEHKKLLTAQVLLTATVDKLAESVAQSVKELREAQKAADDRMSALIGVVDGWIRNRPNA